MSDILKRILAVKRDEVATAQVNQTAGRAACAAEGQPAPRDFLGAMRERIAAGQPAVIAEIKKASPSRGVLRSDFRPAADRRQLSTPRRRLSVGTHRPSVFPGRAAYLQAARAACSLPVLRKDFLVDAYQVHRSAGDGRRRHPADRRGARPAAMRDFEAIADSPGMAVLVEVHNRQELDLALQLATPLIGINNRNLRSFEVSLQTTIDLLPYIPAERLVVTESGILASADVHLMRDHGVNAFLVGEAFMRAANRARRWPSCFPDLPGRRIRRLNACQNCDMRANIRST
jgi:indole-3-glycerol phosphate synthase